MNALLSPWTLVVLLAASLVAQGVVLTVVHRRKSTRQHASHVQAQQTTASQFEQMRRQIAQLQSDLAAARAQLKLFASRRAAPAHSDPGAHVELERELDRAATSRGTLPADGFAETQPSPDFVHARSLLIS